MKFRGTGGCVSPETQENIVFLGQVLDELTFDYSLDSYKAPTMNCATLLREARTLLRDAAEESPDIRRARVRPVIEELCQRLPGNPIVRSIVNGERELALSLQSENFDVVRRTIDSLCDEVSIQGYITTAMDLLISECDNGGKKKIAVLARELVTSLENGGMSRSHIHYATHQFFFNDANPIESSEDLRSFFREVFPHLHDFKIVLKIDRFAERLQEDNFSGFAMTVSETLPEEFAVAPCARRFKNKKEDERFLIVNKIRAFDRYSAIDKAVKRAKLLQNLFRIYHHKNEFGIRSEVVVQQCCVDEVRLASCEKSRMEFVIDDRPGKAAEKLNFLLKNTRSISGPDRTKLFSVAEFHGMSLDASSIENQILNLWISMETLAPSSQNRAKIDCVLEAFLPVTGLNYIRRIFDQVTFDLLRWNRPVAAKILRKVGVAGETPRKKMLRLLALKEHADVRDEVYRELGQFSLLRFRLFTLSEQFSRPSKIFDFLDGHQKRVEWQIRRIYRVRNSIVHLGKTPSFTEMIVDNAHDYLDQALKTCNDISCGPNGLGSFRACFDFLSCEYEVYRGAINDSPDVDESLLERLFWVKRHVPQREDVISKKVARKIDDKDSLQSDAVH